jgi:hypothetical protein
MASICSDVKHLLRFLKHTFISNKYNKEGLSEESQNKLPKGVLTINSLGLTQ